MSLWNSFLYEIQVAGAGGNITLSETNIKTTDDMLGLSSGHFCTQRRPIYMLLKTFDIGNECSISESNSSEAFPLVQRFHA